MPSLKNSSYHWDWLWGNKVFSVLVGHAVENLYRRVIYFSAFDRLLSSISLADKDILELGSGTGNNSLYLARQHHTRSVTLVDFSKQALVNVAATRYECPVIKVERDLFEFQPQKSYDFVHSAGLIEHFEGDRRLAIVRKHAEFACQDGLVMIWVPVYSPAFSLIGRFNRLLGIKEIPLTKRELKMLCVQSGLDIIREDYSAFGALYGVLARKV